MRKAMVSWFGQRPIVCWTLLLYLLYVAVAYCCLLVGFQHLAFFWPHLPMLLFEDMFGYGLLPGLVWLFLGLAAVAVVSVLVQASVGPQRPVRRSSAVVIGAAIALASPIASALALAVGVV